MTEPLVRARKLKKTFRPTRDWFGFMSGGGREGGAAKKTTAAVKCLDLDIYPGEALGLVGESGSGKSTAGRLILRLLDADSGTVEFDGTDLMSLDSASLRQMRRHMAMVFQDPLASLNPRISIRDTIREPMDLHGLGSPKERDAKVEALAEAVGLQEKLTKDTVLHRDQLSGGQRQRVGIARALASEPKFIVADEPISNLDVSIQAQILNLFARLREEHGLTLLFIAHDLATVRHLCDRVAVMQSGEIVEIGETDQIFNEPAHPYTRRLLDAIPRPPAAR